MFSLIAVMHIIIDEGTWSVFICTEVLAFRIWSEEGRWPVPCLSASLGINKHLDIIVSVSGIVANILNMSLLKKKREGGSLDGIPAETVDWKQLLCSVVHIGCFVICCQIVP